MADRETALRTLAIGDIFHARAPNGASLVCLVTAVDEATIYARRIHTQDDVRFDRGTGMQLGEGGSRIDCIEPLPPDIQEILLGLDRRGQAVAAMFRNGIEPGIEQYRVTPDEKRADRFLSEHIEANPI